MKDSLKMGWCTLIGGWESQPFNLPAVETYGFSRLILSPVRRGRAWGNSTVKRPVDWIRDRLHKESLADERWTNVS